MPDDLDNIWGVDKQAAEKQERARIKSEQTQQASAKEQRAAREKLLILSEELRRRQADDPLRLFQPHPKQKKFIDAVMDGPTSENWFIAANRSGKSDGGAFCGATLARFGDQGSDVKWVGAADSNISIRDRSTSGWVSSLDFPTSRDVIEPKYFDNGFVPPGAPHKPFIPQREIEEWRSTDRILKLKNGSIIGFKSADSGRSKYQGAEKDWVHVDEEHPKEIHEEMSIRVGARKLRLFCTCTLLPPVGQAGGITWVFPEVIERWNSGLLPHVGLFSSSIYDNPHIPLSEIAILEAKFPPTSTEGRIRLGGEWLPGLSGARAYTSFDRRLNVRPQPLINLRRPLAWIWDFNVEPLVSLIGQTENLPSGRRLFRVFKELTIEGSASIPDMVEFFISTHPKHLAEIQVFGDASGKARNPQSNKTDYTVIFNEMRHYGVPLRMRVPEYNPSVPDRINAVNRVMRDEDGENRFECDPSCVELIRDFEQVLRDKKGGIKKVTNRKDPYFFRTHTSDAAGYWICHEEPVRYVGREVQTSISIKPPQYAFSRETTRGPNRG